MPQENEFEANVGESSAEQSQTAHPSEEEGTAQAASPQQAEERLGEPSGDGDGPNR